MDELGSLGTAYEQDLAEHESAYMAVHLLLPGHTPTLRAHSWVHGISNRMVVGLLSY